MLEVYTALSSLAPLHVAYPWNGRILSSRDIAPPRNRTWADVRERTSWNRVETILFTVAPPRGPQVPLRRYANQRPCPPYPQRYSHPQHVQTALVTSCTTSVQAAAGIQERFFLSHQTRLTLIGRIPHDKYSTLLPHTPTRRSG
jgi:hypothetical protein